MAITIPSKNIYSIENPKIRDNVIERIELNEIDILPLNTYEEPVYNGTFIYKNQNDVEAQDDLSIDWDVKKDFPLPGEYIYGEAILYSQIIGIYFSGIASIPRVKDNGFITKIFSGTKKISENLEEAEVKYVANCEKKEGTFSIAGTIYDSDLSNGISPNDIVLDKKNIKRTYDSKITQLKLPTNILAKNSVKDSHSFEDYDGHTETISVSISREISFNDVKTNLKELNVTENSDFYTFRFTVLCGAIIDTGRTSYFHKGLYGSEEGDFDEERNINIIGETEFYEPKTIELTVYGNKISIDLKDKTIYINGQKEKKVQSFDGNELMQTSNYSTNPLEETSFAVTPLGHFGYNSNMDVEVFHISSNRKLELGKTYYYNLDSMYVVNNTSEGYEVWVQPNGAIYEAFIGSPNDSFIFSTYQTHASQMYAKTQELYKNGKETITLRCSISNYYDYGTNERCISTEDKELPMCFSIGDKVIPMVRNGKGEDIPISVTADGQPKTFMVLGTKVYYDGAVWQELSLQEYSFIVDTPPEVPTTLEPPTIEIRDDLLVIMPNDEMSTAYDIYMDGELVDTVDRSTLSFDLSTLGLTNGTYEIYVVATADGYDDSQISNIVQYKRNGMIIENIYIKDGDDEPYAVMDGYSDESTKGDGYTTFSYESLDLEIKITDTKLENLDSNLFLKAGQKITFYPFNHMGTGYPEYSTNFEYQIIIPERTNGIIYYNGTRTLWSQGSIYWRYAPVTIRFMRNDETGVCTIDARDRDGSGNFATGVDFLQGVTIEVYES